MFYKVKYNFYVLGDYFLKIQTPLKSRKTIFDHVVKIQIWGSR